MILMGNPRHRKLCATLHVPRYMCIFLDTDLVVSSRLSVRSDNRLVQNSWLELRTEIHVVFPGPRGRKSDGREDIWPLTVESHL